MMPSRGGYVDGPLFVRLTSDGAIIDAMPSPDPIPNVALPELLLGASASIHTAIPYSPRSFLVWNPLGFWITGRSDRYAFELRLPRGGSSPSRLVWHEGDPVVSVRRDVPLVTVDSAEREEQETRLSAQIKLLSTSFGLAGSRAPVPSVKPAWRSIVAAPDGRIWVQPSMPSEPYEPSQVETQKNLTAVHWREAIAYDVFEADGALLGRVSVPPDLHVITMRGDVLWGVVTRNDASQTVERYRIAW
jgi:hypothetical protein